MTSWTSDTTPGAAETVASRVPDSESASCGALLRRAREQRGLTVQQIADRTKIPVRHLTALERDDFAALPAGLYRRAEVRAYAEAVGLDRSVALAWFDRAVEQATPRAPASIDAAPPPPMLAIGRHGWLVMAAGALVLAVTALPMWTRQPAATEVASVDAPVSPTPHVLKPVLLATSSTPLEQADARANRDIEPRALNVSNVPLPADGSDDTESAASVPETQFTVITVPAGARVTVDGIGWGISPVTIRYVGPGAKQVRVTRDGYRAEERVVHVDSGGRATVRIPLRAQAGEGGAAPDVLAEREGTSN